MTRNNKITAVAYVIAAVLLGWLDIKMSMLHYSNFMTAMIPHIWTLAVATGIFLLIRANHGKQ